MDVDGGRALGDHVSIEQAGTKHVHFAGCVLVHFLRGHTVYQPRLTRRREEIGGRRLIRPEEEESSCHIARFMIRLGCA